MSNRICDESLLKQTVTTVFFISDNVLNGDLCPEDERSVNEIIDDMQKQADVINSTISALREILGGISLD